MNRGIRCTQQRRSLDESRKGKLKGDKWTEPVLQYLDKRLFVQLNGSRKVIGVLRGYDVSRAPFIMSVLQNVNRLYRFS